MEDGIKHMSNNYDDVSAHEGGGEEEKKKKKKKDKEGSHGMVTGVWFKKNRRKQPSDQREREHEQTSNFKQTRRKTSIKYVHTYMIYQYICTYVCKDFEGYDFVTCS